MKSDSFTRYKSLNSDMQSHIFVKPFGLLNIISPNEVSIKVFVDNQLLEYLIWQLQVGESQRYRGMFVF